ncbi:uncharacterized protein LOC107883263 [Acyrthosiphon pisum]|uniref:Uncharacterized protein n=1 Tax=Acyrthosiphon pisum TaxID=7029 RepID=A0A8R2JKP9_ACYPI|nr:uncharacterized protein LOC107883263 [Acyrthosiphon pisum]
MYWELGLHKKCRVSNVRTEKMMSVGVYRVRTKCLVPGQSPIYSEPSSDYQSNSKHSRQSPNYNEPSSSHLQTNSKNARRSLSYSREPSNVYQSDSKHFRPSTSYNEPSSGHSETNSSNIMNIHVQVQTILINLPAVVVKLTQIFKTAY